VEAYAIRTKPGSFKGANKSPHRIFAAALTKDPTAPELHRDFFSFIDMFIAGSWRTSLERALHRQRKTVCLRLAITKSTSFQARQHGFHDLWGHFMFL